MKMTHCPVKIRASKMVTARPMSIDGNEPVTMVSVEIPVEIVVDKALAKDRDFTHLFPFGKEAIDTIAGREDDEKRGLDMTARGDVGDMNIALFDTPLLDDVDPAPKFTFNPAEVKGKAKLAIDEDGNGVLKMKIQVWMTQDRVGLLGPYIDGDIYISATDVNQSLFSAESDAPVTKPPKTSTTKKRDATGVDSKSLGKHDAIIDGKRIEVEPKAAALAEEAADAVISTEQILQSARSSVLLSADPKSNRIKVTVTDVEEVIESLRQTAAQPN